LSIRRGNIESSPEILQECKEITSLSLSTPSAILLISIRDFFSKPKTTKNQQNFLDLWKKNLSLLLDYCCMQAGNLLPLFEVKKVSYHKTRNLVLES
jgi:hypothetical protein